MQSKMKESYNKRILDFYKIMKFVRKKKWRYVSSIKIKKNFNQIKI